MKRDKIIVALGSKNPIKIEAAKEAFKKVFGDVEIISVEVDSGVGEQPFTNEMTLIGAINRAKRAFAKIKNADYGVGIEGGVYVASVGAFVNGWVAVTNGERFGYASTISALLPKSITEMFEKGEIRELEEGIEKISKIKNPGDKMGAIGVLTNNLLDRKKAFVDAIIAALAPFTTNFY